MDPPETEPESARDADRRDRVLGTAFNVGGQVAMQLMRLGANLVLTRLLFPEAFGVMALVNTIIVGLQLVSDLGIVPSIIQNEREDRDFLDTAWSLSVVRGVMLGLAGVAIAFPMADFYGEPQLLQLVPAASMTPLIYGFLPTKLHVCLRHRRLVAWTLVMVVSKALAVALMVVLAIQYQSIWALVIGALAEQLFQVAIASFFIDGPMNRFRLERGAALDLFHFGKWIFLSTMVTFLGTKFDIFSLPKMSDLQTTGVYQIAIMLAMFPMTIGGQVINSALLPALSESHRASHEQLQASFRSARELMLPLHVLVTLGLVLGGPPFFRLYDERYADAGWIVQLFMISIWFQYLIEAWGRALLARGNARPLVAVNVVRLVATAVGCIAGYKLGGLPGFIIGNAVGAFAAYIVVHIALRMNGLPALDLDVRYGLLTLVLGFVGGYFPREIATYWGIADPLWIQLGVGIAIGIPVTIWAGRSLIGHLGRREA